MARVRKIVLIHKRAPGDTLVLTGLVRDIAIARPGEFQIDVDTSAMDLWRHNPYLTPLRKRKEKKDVEFINIQYGQGIREQKYEPIHFLAYFHRDFAKQCGVTIPLQLPYPDLHLSAAEKLPIIDGRYWVVLSGGKSDFTGKVWETKRFQEVVDRLHAVGLGVVQVGSNERGHWHPPLDRVINLVGRTNLRDLMRLIYHADGVICGVTCAMHMAAALQRPCVVLGGGREAWWWEAYDYRNRGLAPANTKPQVSHRFLHTIGLLECCKFHGCWKNKVVKINEDKSVCTHPVLKPDQPVPLCMDMITADHVMEAVMSYYQDSTLPPITSPAALRQPAETPIVPVVPRRSQPPLLDLFGDPLATLPLENRPDQPATAMQAKTVIVPKGQHIRLCPTAKLEGRPNATRPVATQPQQAAAPITDAIFDHPDIGGKFTICVLLYGPAQFYDLHVRCLNAIIGTVPADRMDLRIGSNELNTKSCQLVDQLVRNGLCTKHYRHQDNAFKYPVMREMFWDPQHPITTKWIVWFDDDSIADRSPDWLKMLAATITQHYRTDNAHMYGAKMIWTLLPGQRQWYTSRPWYRGRPWRLGNGKPAPNGNKIIFATGSWWCLSTEAMRACDIPDPDLGHNGGDYTIGEQLYQGGFNIKNFNARKQWVNMSSVPRRGVTQPPPGTKANTRP